MYKLINFFFKIKKGWQPPLLGEGVTNEPPPKVDRGGLPPPPRSMGVAREPPYPLGGVAVEPLPNLAGGGPSATPRPWGGAWPTPNQIKGGRAPPHGSTTPGHLYIYLLLIKNDMYHHP